MESWAPLNSYFSKFIKTYFDFYYKVQQLVKKNTLNNENK